LPSAAGCVEVKGKWSKLGPKLSNWISVKIISVQRTNKVSVQRTNNKQKKFYKDIRYW
jgi:hypothetical protein